MEDVTKLKVTAADRLNGSVIITFNDGACGVYSSELLHSMLASAQQLHDADSDEAKAPAGNYKACQTPHAATERQVTALNKR